MTKTVQPLVYHINIYYLEEWVNKVEKMYMSFSLVVVSHIYFFEHVKNYFVQCPNFRVPNILSKFIRGCTQHRNDLIFYDNLLRISSINVIDDSM